MGFSSQEYWIGLPCPHPGDLPDPGIELTSLMSPALADRFFTTSATWEASLSMYYCPNTSPFNLLIWPMKTSEKAWKQFHVNLIIW